jgi:hypothetical protein
MTMIIGNAMVCAAGEQDDKITRISGELAAAEQQRKRAENAG